MRPEIIINLMIYRYFFKLATQEIETLPRLEVLKWVLIFQ